MTRLILQLLLLLSPPPATPAAGAVSAAANLPAIARPARPVVARTLAILNFDNHTGKPDYEPIGGGLAAMMISDLSASPDLKLVERERMQDILAEQKMQRSPMFDSTTAVKAGKLLGAEFIATGSLASGGTELRIDMRVMKVETGEIVKTAKVAGPEDKLFDLEKELAGDVLKDLDIAMSPESAALMAKRQEANRQLGVNSFKSFSNALTLINTGDYVGAAGKLQPLLFASPDSRLVSLAYEEAKRRASNKVADEAKKKANDLLKGIFKRP